MGLGDLPEIPEPERTDNVTPPPPEPKKRESGETLYVARRQTFLADSFEEGLVTVRRASEKEGKGRTMTTEEFKEQYEPLKSAPESLRWKLQIQDPDSVPRSLWGAQGPDIRKIYSYVDKIYEASDSEDRKVPAVPGVLISGPAC